MRKRIIGGDAVLSPTVPWLDLERIAEAELTSEEAGFPIEAAVAGRGNGWRAGLPGPQTIRLLFDPPRDIHRIRLEFREADRARTQEFVLRWTPAGGDTSREIVRQQYTFAPPGTTVEVEEYMVELGGLSALEIRIVPDVSGGDARASLSVLRLAGQ